ncbi:glycosyltransferase [Flavobacterium chuncheonense]|uniref:Glycosyltransferase n=1 Tax=Flavobacterium chuncheonense TaxID=2026653 RepID=A0ABW5YP91_9FLAO
MKQKLYFICTDGKTPAGGVKQIYRQVDILNKNGYDACVVHRKKGFRHKWFKNETKIIYNLSLFKDIENIILKKEFKPYKAVKNYIRSKNDDVIEESGIIIFPEIYGPTINLILPNMKKVVFNQNCFYTFDNCEPNIISSSSIYKNDTNFLGTIVVSENSKNYIEFAFPNTKVYRIKLGIDNQKFFYNQTAKEKLIAYMPRKRKDDITQIIQILHSRNNLNNWNFIEIDNKTEDEVATILNKSTFFLSLNHKEGFGLPPAEAMASGCITIGFTGHGGKEYFKPEFTYEIEDGNIIEFISQVEKTINAYDNNPNEFERKAKAASMFIKTNYNMEEEEKSIITVWDQLLKNQ